MRSSARVNRPAREANEAKGAAGKSAMNAVEVDRIAAGAIVPLLSYQRADVESGARFRWNCWARQTGKSFTKSLRRILRALQTGRDQIFLSAGERQSRELMEKARMHCHALQLACSAQDGWFRDMNIRQLEIVLPGGARVIGLPANPMTARGYTGDVLLDEFAMHADDRDIWAAMFPALLRGGGELDVCSTPHGCDNMFSDLRHNEAFEHSTVTLPEAIGQGLDVDEREIRSAMGDDLLYRQEFLCEFLDEAGSFLSRGQVNACIDPAIAPADSVAPLVDEPRPMFAGLDIGRVRDMTVLWVVTRCGTDDPAPSTGQDTLRTVALVELREATFAAQRELIEKLLAIRNVRRLCVDATGMGMPLAEGWAERFGSRRVEAVTFTESTRSALAAEFRAAVETQRIRIPADAAIVRDWLSVERTIGSAGRWRLAAPRRDGSHADRFWAAALAVRAARERAGAIESQFIGPRAFARQGAW